MSTPHVKISGWRSPVEDPRWALAGFWVWPYSWRKSETNITVIRQPRAGASEAGKPSAEQAVEVQATAEPPEPPQDSPWSDPVRGPIIWRIPGPGRKGGTP